jgi:hypothetical protein
MSRESLRDRFRAGDTSKEYGTFYPRGTNQIGEMTKYTPKVVPRRPKNHLVTIPAVSGPIYVDILPWPLRVTGAVRAARCSIPRRLGVPRSWLFW